MPFWDPKEGVSEIDIVGFTAGKGNPYAKEGEYHYERTFYVYNKVGPDEKKYIGPIS